MTSSFGTLPRLIQGNCLDRMGEIKDGEVDLVLCDLPYGITGSPWDCAIPLPALWDQYNRICKGPVVLFAAQPFTSALVMSNPKAFRHDWVWSKNKVSGHLNAKKRPMSAHESVVVFSKKPPLYNPQMTSGHKPGNHAMRSVDTLVYGKHESTPYGGSTQRYPRSVQNFDIVNNDDPTKCHPNQKPVEFLEYLIRTYSTDGAVVLDNTMGGGSTGVACVNTGRSFIGIEMDAAYFAAASKRIEEARVLKNA